MTNDSEPMRNIPLGPGILLAMIRFLISLYKSIATFTRIVKMTVEQIKYRTLDWFT